jgi:hypothetical protein
MPVPSKDEFPDVQVEAVLLQPGMRLWAISIF